MLFVRLVYTTFIIFLFLSRASFLFATELDEDCGSPLVRDLMWVECLNRSINQTFPVSYDHLLQGGYFNMPSARMGNEGEIGFGYAWVPPYYQYNLKLQLIDFLEISGTYRIFRNLHQKDYDEDSDKGVNVKLSLFKPEDSHYRLPGIAIGLEDFLGASNFMAYYVVLTKVWLDYNFELSIGYGVNRIHKWFGGINWMPFLQSNHDYLKSLALTLEYDAIPYKHKKVGLDHKGRIKKSSINFGLKYKLWNLFDLSASYIRGNAYAFSLSYTYDFGNTKGLLPKMSNSLPYTNPINHEPLGYLRTEDVMMNDYIFAMQDQGLTVTEAWLCQEKGETVLRLKIVNDLYREEIAFRERLSSLLAALTPNNIDKVIVVLDCFMVSCQEYHFHTKFLKRFHQKEMGQYEMDVLSPVQEVSHPELIRAKQIYKKPKDWYNIEIMPRTQTLFGNATGKFKYALGLTVDINGFIWDDLYYTVSLGYFALSDLKHMSDIDTENPSQLLCVRSDIIRYYEQRSITVDEAYLEKVWNWGKGWYTRIAVGLLEIEYGGTGVEWLYYPVNSSWAVGMDFAVLKKRTPDSYGFTSFVRKLKGLKPHWYRFVGSQYFLNLYYDWKCSSVLFKINAGKFLADDFGARFEISRYFPSGLQVGFWYTLTNGNDKINGQTYFDKGVFFSMPLDIVYTKSSRSRWGYGMSPYLRDVGARAYTGTELYDFINQQRQDK